MSNLKKAVLIVCSEEEIDYAIKNSWTILVRKRYPNNIDKPFEVYLYCKKPHFKVMAKGTYAHHSICEFGGKDHYNWTIKNIVPLDQSPLLLMENGLGGYTGVHDRPTVWQYVYTN